MSKSEAKSLVLKQLLKRPGVFFLSLGGIGFLPISGTMGSLATMPLLFLFHFLQAPYILVVPFLCMVTFGTCLVAEFEQRFFKVHDPGWIVMDELLGLILTWITCSLVQDIWFLQNWDHSKLFWCFLFFRFFDIVKFWPASYFDKKVTHGAGTVADDLVSAVYAGVFAAIADHFISL